MEKQFLRFKKFGGGIKKVRLSQVITKVSSGKGKLSVEGIFPLYGSTGIIGKSKSPAYEGKYILIARVGANAGSMQIADGLFDVTDNTLIIEQSSAIEVGYLYCALGGKNLNKLRFGSGQPLITAGILKTLEIPVPSLPEQQKIASFFTVVDRKLAQLRQKKEALERYKKGVMQALFSRRLRFKDDEGKEFGEWEEKNAGKLFANISNKSHNGDLPILAITQDKGAILRDDLDMKIISSEKSVQGYKIVDVGDFIISLRSFQGGIEYSNVRGICSPVYTILRATLPISATFFKYYFKKDSFIEELNNLVVGIRDGKQISYAAFATLTLPYPSVAEQEKIGYFLERFDMKINEVQLQIGKVTEWKRGLLQKMFV